jgi:hypothetical protein
VENHAEELVHEKNNIRTSIGIFGLAILAAIAAWQFYLFAAFKGTDGVVDVQGGKIHLWLAIGITFLVCIAGFFLFSRWLRYDKQNDIHITVQGHPLGVGKTSKNRL